MTRVPRMLKIPELRGLSASNSDKTSSIFKGKRWKMTLERKTRGSGRHLSLFEWMGGLGQKDGNYDG